MKRNLFNVYLFSMMLIIITTTILLLTMPVKSASQHCIENAFEWMGADEFGTLPEGVSVFDYHTQNEDWNFPEWVSPVALDTLFEANGGVQIFGFRPPEGQIITEPRVQVEQEQYKSITFHIFYCSLKGSAPDGKQHDIIVFKQDFTPSWVLDYLASEKR